MYVMHAYKMIRLCVCGSISMTDERCSLMIETLLLDNNADNNCSSIPANMLTTNPMPISMTKITAAAFNTL